MCKYAARSYKLLITDFMWNEPACDFFCANSANIFVIEVIFIWMDLIPKIIIFRSFLNQFKIKHIYILSG